MMRFALADAKIIVRDADVVKSNLLARIFAESARSAVGALQLRQLSRRQFETWLHGVPADETTLEAALEMFEVRLHCLTQSCNNAMGRSASKPAERHRLFHHGHQAMLRAAGPRVIRAGTAGSQVVFTTVTCAAVCIEHKA